jgi:DNA-binding winged helix-turn-helix (wHTH) protein
MLETPGEVVTREELRQLLWGTQTFVDFEHGLNAVINKLREVLGDTAANPRFIETIPRRGYRFLAEVTGRPAPGESHHGSNSSGHPEDLTHSFIRSAKILAGAGALIIGSAALAWYARDRAAVPPRDSIRFEIALSGTSNSPPFRLSPDGRNIVIANNQLWVRPLDSFEARPLPGTDGAYDPFWSPESDMLGFFAQGKLKKISLRGGLPETLCDARGARGGTWSREGVIVFASDAVQTLLRVPVAGGVSAPATRVAGDASEQHRYPEFLPDGRHFMFLCLRAKPELSGVYAGSIDGATPIRILSEPSNALYAPDRFTHRNGHLLFRRGSTVMAQPFDPDRLQKTAEALPIADEVGISRGSAGLGAFSVSETGALAYQSGPGGGSNQFVWVDRTGKRGRVVAKHGAGIWPAMSPDETRAVFTMQNLDGSQDLWLQNLDDEGLSRFTSGPGANIAGIWSPDGRQIAFYRFAGGQFQLFRKPASGAASEESLTRLPALGRPSDWSLDGKFLVFSEFSGTTRCDLWLLPLQGDRKPYPYVQTVADEYSAQFSPDAHWMAYVSDESGRPEIWVQSIPPNRGKRQVSTTGGNQPRWRRDGRELFYVSADEKLMTVSIRPGTSFEAGAPQELPDVRVASSLGGPFLYGPAANGKRFLVSEPGPGNQPRISVVLNWQAALQR